jgi:molybdopterin-binding protein
VLIKNAIIQSLFFQKKLFFSPVTIFILVIFLNISCSTNSENTTKTIDIDTAQSVNIAPIIEEKAVQSVRLDEFGMAYEVPESISFLQKNNQFVSTLVPNGGNAESGEFVVITPTVESVENITSELQQAGFEVGTDSFNNLTASISNVEEGVTISSTMVQSPAGGGLLVMHILKSGVNQSISNENLQNIIQSVSHYQPTWSLENRIAFYQQQQQLNEQQKLAEIRANHEKNQLDMLGLQLDGLIGR